GTTVIRHEILRFSTLSATVGLPTLDPFIPEARARRCGTPPRGVGRLAHRTSMLDRTPSANDEGERPMNARSNASQEPTTPRTHLERRGLMAGLAALAVGLLSKATTRVAQASSALMVGETNGSTVTTQQTAAGRQATSQRSS